MEKKSDKKISYILTACIFTVLLSAIYIFHSAYQDKQLVYAVEETPELSFKSSVELTKWHNTEAKYVYLTFDDGPSNNASKILDILKEYKVPATFFVLGSTINRNSQAQDILNRMVDEGHYIGLHSMTHDKDILYGLNGPANFVREMKEVQTLISTLTDGFRK